MCGASVAGRPTSPLTPPFSFFQDCQLTVRKVNDRQYVAKMPNVRARASVHAGARA